MAEQARRFSPKGLAYEEDNVGTTVYKFPIETISPHEWRRAHDESWYRVVGPRVQYYARESGYSESWGRPLEDFIRGLDPLMEDHAMEIWFGRDDAGYFVRSHDCGEEIIAASLEALTRESLVAALKQMFSEWQGC